MLFSMSARSEKLGQNLVRSALLTAAPGVEGSSQQQTSPFELGTRVLRNTTKSPPFAFRFMGKLQDTEIIGATWAADKSSRKPIEASGKTPTIQAIGTSQSKKGPQDPPFGSIMGSAINPLSQQDVESHY